MASTFEAVRAKALFVSCLQPSERPRVDAVRTAVSESLRDYGIRGCASAVAAEFGHHPECAVARMNWALTTVRVAYPELSAAIRATRAA
jgi:hypothetical protein